MKIKDVEQILEIPKASIRFYEKEGLIHPQRGDNKYREYSDEDVEQLKKIIVLRKIGVPVEDIKKALHHEIALQDILSDNLVKLEKQMQEIKGAIKVCELMQKNQEDMESFDEVYYWDVIHAEEREGNRFFEIVNDIVQFEKRVIFDEFGLADESGVLKFSPGKSIAIAFFMCLAGGLLWFFLDDMHIEAFVEGFFFPFVCIVITSVFGLPMYFLEKKHKKAANIIKKIGKGLCVLFCIAILILVVWMMFL